MQNADKPLDKIEMVVRSVTDEAKFVRSYELAYQNDGELPAHHPGAHLAVHLPNGITRQYSLFDEPGVKRSYRIAVLNDPKSRGGSRYMHENVAVGDRLKVSGPFNLFPMATRARSALLIAGGIGVTPILSMAHELHSAGLPFALHYCARNEEEAAFVEFLRNKAPFSSRVTMHFDGGDPRNGLNLTQLLESPVDGCHVYCCGPNGLMNAVEAASSNWASGTVHFERFSVETGTFTENKAFKIFLKRSALELDVPPEKSILTVLNEAGFQIDTVCEQGVCGACMTDVLEGVPDHRDQILTDEEKKANDVITVCCSRAKSAKLVLDI